MIRQGYCMLSMLLVIVTLSAVPANAQSSIAQRAYVPFDFVVDDEVMPAGEYFITTHESQGMVLRVSGPISATLVLTIDTGKSANGKNQWVFNRYGERYFLSAIWASRSGQIRQLRKSSLERELLARNATPSIELIAAHRP